jgi:putative transposase
MVGTARCAVRRMSLQPMNTDSRTPQRGVPTRKTLPHEVPLWLDPSNEDYFVTICCRQRGRNQLAIPAVGFELIDTVKHRNDRQVWCPYLAVVMPDHVHLVLSFGRTDKRTQLIVSKWKEWTAKTLSIHWQRDFFEHRLRRDESFREKADYVLANPVRAGFVEHWEDWPYLFIANLW